MTPEAWATAAIVVLVLVGLVVELASPAVLVFGAVVALLLTGVLEPGAALAGFSNPAPFTVAALFVVAAAVSKTGAIRPFTRGLMGTTGNTRRPMLRMLVPVTAASGFLNNIPLVAMMIPEVFSWAKSRGNDAARFLLPLSYGAILGGLLTIIGTSTNLVVAGQMSEVGLDPFGFFELGVVGLPIALLGILTIVALSPRLLRGALSSRSMLEETERSYSLDIEVVPEGPLDGVTIEEAGLRHLAGVFLASVDRGSSVVAPASPSTVIRGGNILRFVGRVDQILDLQSIKGLRHSEPVSELSSRGAAYYTVAVGADSPLVGRNLREADFRSNYSAAVVAIHRAGERVDSKLGDVTLRVGDALVLISDSSFPRRWANSPDFLVISDLAGEAEPVVKGAGRTIVVLALMVIAAATGALPVLQAALAAAILMILLGVLTPAEARRAVNMEVLVVIASAFGLAAAVDASGLGGVVADGIISTFGALGEYGVLLGVVLATVALTELVTNNAAALLLLPIAISAAPAAGVDPRGMALAVAIAASASFLTPLGYQTNTMVYGPGGYRLTDYVKAGVPLTVLAVAVVVLMVPALY